MADASEILVWPWTGILATEDDGGAAALAAHARQLPDAVATTALEEEAPPYRHCRGHHHFLVLHFGRSLQGLRAAASIAGLFPGAGRTEWRRRESSGPVYGWAAVEEDLRGEDAVGMFLRATGARGAAADAIAGELESAAEQETRRLRHELAELRAIADKVIPEMNRDLEDENEKLKAELDAASREIELKMEKIAQLENLDKDNGPTQGASEINTLDLAAGGECKVDDHALMLHENHKQEMEAIRTKLTQLEKQLAQREALVFTAQQLNMRVQAGEKLNEEDHQHLYAVVMSWWHILDEEQKRLKASCVNLIERERKNSKELQENRQELIQAFLFYFACKRKYSDDDPDGKAARLISSWQEEMKEPSWHPFTTIQVDEEDKEVIDDDDPKLKQLRIDYGDSVCYAVKVAMSELNENSPYGRHVFNELWNFREGRKATTAEVFMCILEQLTPANLGYISGMGI
ncbi:hypothetical protein BRADI_2g03140v3 [Brachypodium distachyon]|uniref:Factor of DNA methylation 1-5/IDN2 domain-containing protein n=1 Tax=Brachypodium distachyon TaxID=15368 RepID=A0A0Q3IQW9_BRADI|nr:hypothetical protein BRADI_2g03140v3 [Brachypodium distachyon]